MVSAMASGHAGIGGKGTRDSERDTHMTIKTVLTTTL